MLARYPNVSTFACWSFGVNTCDSVHVGTIRGRWDEDLLCSRVLFQCS